MSNMSKLDTCKLAVHSMAHLLCWGLGEPLRAVIKALTSLGKAASSSDVTDRQAVGAAMDVILAASGLRQRAASKGEAVAEVLAQAAAGASCKGLHKMTSNSTLSEEAVLPDLINMGECAISEHYRQSCSKARVMHVRQACLA